MGIFGKKYFKREGSPGDYTYYYTEAEYKEAKGKEEEKPKHQAKQEEDKPKEKTKEQQIAEVYAYCDKVIKEHPRDLFTHLKGEKVSNAEAMSILRRKFNNDLNKTLNYDSKVIDKKFIISIAEQINDISESVPNGHFYNNDCLKGFNINFDEGAGFANYNTGNNKISFEKDFVESLFQPDDIDNIKNKQEVKETFCHELGHSVQEKFIRTDTDNNTELFKSFGKALGWGDEVGIKYIINENKKAVPIKREKEFKLLTKYAELNPTEAFAEYYSFYNMNFKLINDYIDGKVEDSIFNKTQEFKYRGYKITHQQIKESVKAFSWMRENIFDNDELTKSLQFDEWLKMSI